MRNAHVIAIPLVLLCILGFLIHMAIQESHHTKVVAYTYSGTIAIPTEEEFVLFKERVAQYDISLNAFQVLNLGYPVLVHFGAPGSKLYFSSPDAPELFPYGNPQPVTQTLGRELPYVIASIVTGGLALWWTLAGMIGIAPWQKEDTEV